MKQFLFSTALTICFLVLTVSAQTEILTNAQIIEMSKIGLDKEIILKKINDSGNDFDISANALIELKKSGVANEVITLVLAKGEAKRAESGGFSENQPVPVSSDKKPNDNSPQYSETPSTAETQKFIPTTAVVSPKEALMNAKTLAIFKSSLNPSRQALEKALLKRKEWQKYNLTLVRYKEEADIYIEIGRIPLSWITHRYVFRIYDRRTGTIITAGETTSWGSLAENLAREVTQKMNTVAGN